MFVATRSATADGAVRSGEEVVVTLIEFPSAPVFPASSSQRTAYQYVVDGEQVAST